MAKHPIVLRELDFPVLVRSPRPVPRDPQYGVVSPSYRERTTRQRAREEVVAGFTTQLLRLRLGDAVVEFRPARETDNRFPFEHPVLVASTTLNAYAPPPVYHEDHLRAVGIDADLQWLDLMVVLRESQRALEVCRSYDTGYALRWSAEGMELLDLSGWTVATWQVRGRRTAHRCCPLIRDARPGDLCRRHGGPWIGRSIIAAGNWLDRRSLYRRYLGCDEVCAEMTDRRTYRVPTRYREWEDLEETVFDPQSRSWVTRPRGLQHPG